MIETATFGGGCFWCTEAFFKIVKGVLRVESGYSGGALNNPSYKDVCRGDTGHAEVVQITFDNDLISYADILRLHFMSHDPTTLNQQGSDRGTQYRSVIFAHDEAQRNIAKQIIAEMQSEFKDAIVTEVQPFAAFYKAEHYHQNYYENNPDEGYCKIVIEPKVKKFIQKIEYKFLKD
ncbi:MAG: peptide-methionine (S)-S-oxide reductase MsrA [Nitrospiraceae bacterium]|nr:peptide-methionine (S)-S-oxide reductase MsrA [Nitrospiraceae bacterium]